MKSHFTEQHFSALEAQLESQRAGAWNDLLNYIGSTKREQAKGNQLHHELLQATRSVFFVTAARNPRTLSNFLYWEVLERAASASGLAEEWAQFGALPRQCLMSDSDYEIVLAEFTAKFPGLWQFMKEYVASGDITTAEADERRREDLLDAIWQLYSTIPLLQKCGSREDVTKVLSWKLARAAEADQGPWGGAQA